MRTTINLKRLNIYLHIVACLFFCLSLLVATHSTDFLELSVASCIGIICLIDLCLIAMGWLLARIPQYKDKLYLLSLWGPTYLRPILLGSIGTIAVSAPALAQESQVQDKPVSGLEDSLADQELDSNSLFFTESKIPISISANKVFPAQKISAQSETNLFFQDTHLPEVNHQTNKHLVLDGETLWSIAEGLLPTDATPGQIYQKVYEIYLENQNILNHLDAPIYPGQALTLP